MRVSTMCARVGALLAVACSGAACGEDPAAMPAAGMGAGAVSGGAGGMTPSGGMGGMTPASGGMGGSGGMMTELPEPAFVGPASTACVPALGTPAAAHTVVYSGPEALEGLALHTGSLFASDATGIVRLSEGGTALERVTTANVTAFHAADTRIYWIESAQVFRVDFDGLAEAPELVAMNAHAPATFLQNDETNLYYYEGAGLAVWQQPLDGTAAVQLVIGSAIHGMDLHGGALFYAGSDHAIHEQPVEGGDAEEVLAELVRDPVQLDNDGISLIWIDGADVIALDMDDDNAEPVALSQGGPARAGAARSHIERFVRLGKEVYFADHAGSIGRADADEPDACSLLAQHAGEIHGLAVDEGVLFVNVRVGAMTELWRFAI